MSYYIKSITKCQLCENKGLTEVLNFGSSPLANNLKNQATDEEIEAPLEVVMCDNPACNCVQLKYLVDPEVLFSNYNYRSSKGLEKHFKEYAESSLKVYRPPTGSMVVGIGGNIGLLEKEYQKLGYYAVNVEPAKNIAEESAKNGIFTLNDFFDDHSVADLQRKTKREKAHLITANNCLAHTNIFPIINGVQELLHKDGVLIMENAYLLDTIQNLDAFQIYGEHYKYLHIKALANFFRLYELELFYVEHNNAQCGSFRAYIKWASNTELKTDISVNTAIATEIRAGLHEPKTYAKFMRDLGQLKKQVAGVLTAAKKDKLSVGIFSVAAKTTLMLKWFDLSHLIDYATDDSDLKWNKYIPGTEIPILSPDEFWEKSPDIILVGAYNFAENIIKNNQKNLKEGGRFVIPIPKLEIIKK